MSNFLKSHLQLKSVDSTNIVPKPVEPYLGFPWGPEFQHLADKPRGTNFDSLGFPVKPMSKIDRTVFEVIEQVDALPEIKPIG